MAAVFVQGPTANTAVAAATTVVNASTTPIALAPTTAGSTLVALCHIRAGSTNSVTSVTDSTGTTWTFQVVGFLSGQNTRCEIWTREAAPSVTSVTMTPSASIIGSMCVAEVAGAGSPFVTGGAGAAASANPAAVAVAVPAGGITLGLITYPNATAPTALASPFTALTGASSSGGPEYGANAYHIAATATTEGPAWTLPASVASGAATISLTPTVVGADPLLLRSHWWPFPNLLSF